ncbi:MAG: dipeptidase PepE [Bacteroidales bacterium]|nr:dipeptidase PepE [Bacteroidales bacterium]
MRLLLFSNSTNAGEEYLNYALPYIKSFLGSNAGKGIFIPFAGISIGFDNYFSLVNSKFKTLKLNIHSIHSAKDMLESIYEAGFIVVGGGNTFCLLKEMQKLNLIEPVRQRVQSGIPYIGWSAGSNFACPTISTTNDMPIVEPESFSALHLIPFQINPHYTDFKYKNHAGETREMRIEEFILMNKNLYVAGLREGTLFKIENGQINLLGTKKCRIFKYGDQPVELQPGANFQFLMQ